MSAPISQVPSPPSSDSSNISTPSPASSAVQNTDDVPTSPVHLQQQPPPPPTGLKSSSFAASMSPSSTIAGSLRDARRPGPLPTAVPGRSSNNLPPEMVERMKAFHLQRQGAPPRSNVSTPDIAGSPRAQAFGNTTSPNQRPSSPNLGPGGVPMDFKLPVTAGRPGIPTFPSSPGPRANAPSLAQKRGITLPGGLPGAPPAAEGRKKKPGLTLTQLNNGPATGNVQDKPAGSQATTNSNGSASLLEKYSEYIDAKTGTLRFKGKAVLSNKGVEFEGGRSFSISLDEVDTLDELGKGNYGTVYKVKHSRPRIRRPGLGLAGNRAYTSYTANSLQQSGAGSAPSDACKDDVAASATVSGDGLSGVTMAMKEMRLELDDAKLATIIMELDVLHRCISPFIVDFYGAFFQEGAVYICLEFMDGGSVDKLYGGGVPENVLRKITLGTTLGLKFLKEDYNIIHRDVKPTNILVNTRGQVKICDFGVSGKLVASIAKTNIGCQSYMAPERIAGGGMAQSSENAVGGGGTYSVQSDIWSLGLTIIECAMGRYPYPQETYDNIFSQLSAIVNGEPPDLPQDSYSEAAHDFVRGCLRKVAKLRPTYDMLIKHAWLAPLMKPPTIQEDDDETSAASAPVVSMGTAAASAAANSIAAATANAAGTGTATTEPDASAPRVGAAATSSTEDAEIAAWVREALERKRGGTVTKPALHAAKLDAVSETSPIVARAGGFLAE